MKQLSLREVVGLVDSATASSVPFGESPDQTFLDSLQKCRSCAHTKVGDVPLLLVLNRTRRRKENRTFLLVSSSHSWFSRLLACHAARLTQKTSSYSQSRVNQQVKFLEWQQWNVSKTFLKMHIKPTSAMETWLMCLIYLEEVVIHVKGKQCKHGNWVRIIWRKKKWSRCFRIQPHYQ